MNEIKLGIGSVAAVVFTFLTSIAGAWDSALQILLICIVLDYITGIMKGMYKQELASEIGWKGLLRKGAIFFVIILAYQLDLVQGNEVPLFRTAAAYFYIGNEGISLLENLSVLGLPLPEFLLKLFKNMKTESNDYKKVSGDDQ